MLPPAAPALLAAAPGLVPGDGGPGGGLLATGMPGLATGVPGLAVGVPGPALGGDRLPAFLLQLGVLLFGALAFGRLARRVGMPGVVGELLVGVLLGPTALGRLHPAWLVPRDAQQFVPVEAVGQLGVLLLVALTGAGIDLAVLRRRWPTAARVSACGVVLPLGLGVALGLALPASLAGSGRTPFALFLGVAMCVSAVPVIAKILTDLNLQQRNVGQLIMIAGVVDDAVGWLLLSVVSALVAAGGGAGSVALAAGGLVAVVAVALTAGPVLVRAVLGWAANAGTPGPAGERGAEPAAAAVVVLVLLAAAGTGALGLEPVFGAFVCGVLVGACGRLPAGALAGLRTVVLGVLAPVFFATAGLRLDLTRLGRPPVLLAGLAVLAVAVAGKFGGVWLGARWSGVSRWEALALGAGLSARGMVEIIVAGVGLRLGVLTPASYTIVVLVAIATSLMAPPVLRYAMRREHAAAEERARQAAGRGGTEPAPEGRP